MKFRKKPVEIEARQYTDHADPEHVLDLLLWINSQCPGYAPHDTSTHSAICIGPTIRIRTLEGDMYASQDDWIIRGVHGEFYPCKPAIFAATYEPVP